jgi:hypothetical protein
MRKPQRHAVRFSRRVIAFLFVGDINNLGDEIAKAARKLGAEKIVKRLTREMAKGKGKVYVQ